MRRIPWRTLGAVGLVFVATVIARFPAPWVQPLLPKSVTCRGLSGSLWAGSCTGLDVAGSPLGDIDWTLRGAPLLRAELAGSVTLNRPGAVVTTAFALFPSGRIDLSDLHAEIALDRPLYGNLLPRFAGGTLQASLSHLELKGRRLLSLGGRVQALDLLQPGGPPTPLGSYEVRFDSPPQPNGDIVGVVHDLGGPIAFDGTVKLTPAPGFRLEGRVATRGDADPGLARALSFLGAADADGRRPLAEEGTF